MPSGECTSTRDRLAGGNTGCLFLTFLHRLDLQLSIGQGINLKRFNLLIVSPDESRGYLGFSTVTPPPPPQRFPFGRDNLKNILVGTFKFGMWVYMGNATNTIVL